MGKQHNTLSIQSNITGQFLPRQYTKQEVETIISMYNERHSMADIGLTLHIAGEKVRSILTDNGIEIRSKHDRSKERGNKYEFPIEYFSKIDTQDKAYILGFLYADGSNTGTEKRSNANCAAISILAKDVDVLEKMKTFVYADRPAPFYVRYSKSAGKDIATLLFNGNEVSSLLSSYGCVPRKSLILQWPQWLTDPDLQRHFIRGYFDGDGSISLSMGKLAKTPGGNIDICGTFEFLSGIKDILASVNINCRIVKEKRRKTNTWKLRFGGNGVIKQFYAFLYRDSIIHLDRKHKVFADLLDIVKKRDDYNKENTRTLTKQNIADIRILLDEKQTHQTIGRKFGVSKTTVYHIKHNMKAYKDK